MRRSVATLGLLAFAACSGDDAIAPDAGIAGPALSMPALIDLPYVVAGDGTTQLDVPVFNTGTSEAHLTWGLTGPGFTLVSAPSSIDAGAESAITIRWDGADVETIATAQLTAEGDAGTHEAEVWAVAGDPALGEERFAPYHTAASDLIGADVTVSMPTAPYPAPGRTWTDDHVAIFMPWDYRQRDALDVVLHFHGHNTTIDATLAAHHYREQVYASGANVVLVVPQGPVNAASGDFGKLSDPDGTAAFLQEVLVALYRDGLVDRPVLGDVILTSHSGGYVATAQNLAGALSIPQIQLYDSVYGYVTTFRDYALAGGRLRSDYTSGGGTDANNMTLASQLAAMGATVNDAPTTAALASSDPLIYFTPSSHEGSTRERDAYTEQLRWGAPHGRGGPRAELRSVAGGVVTWLAPHDDDVAAWNVETSTDGIAWTLAAQEPATATSATISPAAAWVRVVPSVPGVTEPQPTDTGSTAPDAEVLVVDGFDRIVDGSFAGLAHAFAARVGDAAGGADYASNEAITEDGFDLSAYRVVIWLVGDDSTDDHTFSAAERAAISAYVDGGGHVILSGSEIGYVLGATAAAWLTSVAGATYASDDAGTNTVAGAAFGDANAAYPEEYPDTFTGTQVLAYSTGASAAVGIAGRGAIVGFPLETIDDDDALADVVATLLAFVDQ